jgi:hypothetical protein
MGLVEYKQLLIIVDRLGIDSTEATAAGDTREVELK